jgi:tetratricopeptide (TPR) repeat protein
MIAMDVRIRAVLLTLLLVVMVAAAVQFWPASTPSTTAVVPSEPVLHDSQSGNAIDSQLKRHFDWAVTQLRTGHYQQAINGFRAVLEQAPAMPEAYINTGFAHIELQQFEQALQAFQTAIDLRPGQFNAYWGLAVSLEGLCDIPGAMGAMRTYVHLAEPDDPYLVKANAALWEWEQIKHAGADGGQNAHECYQSGEQKENE